MIWRIFAALVILLAAAGGFLFWTSRAEIAPIANVEAHTFDPAVVTKGAQLAAIGDCAVCHTETSGMPYAGGFPVQSPFGTIYGSNITPDPDTGIGSWSEVAFRRAMREGVDRKGNHLYPAFPYDHFTRASDSDISALYAFIMTREPVHQENRAPDLPFPLNIRLSAAAWKLLFLHAGEYQPDRTQSAEWNRGAYLTAGLGHCGACHTPRNILGAEKYQQDYAGGQGEGWRAPALTAASLAPVPWTVDQLFAYLRFGFADQHGLAAGPMQPIVADLAKTPAADVRAVAIYVSSLMGPKNVTERQQRTQAALKFARERNSVVPGETNIGTTGMTPAGSNDSGAMIFAGACAGCHHGGGELPISRPIELALSTPVNAPEPTDFLHIVLEGVQPRPQQRGPIMPGFADALTDAQITELTTYVRDQFAQGEQWDNIDPALREARKNTEPKAGAP